MSKKRTKKNKIIKLLLIPIKILLFIILSPVKLVKYISDQNKKIQEKSFEKQQQDKRDSINPVYDTFEIIEKQHGDLKDWELKLVKSTIGIILGARGKGKSAIGIKIIENIKAKSNKKIYAMGFNQEDMPSWINTVNDVKQITGSAFVLIDEGGLLFSSRKSMTDANQILTDLILISRHKNLSILFISQNSANLDINILRQADYLILKPSSLLQKDFERKKIKEIYSDVDFSKYTDYKGITYIYSEEFRGFINNSLPSFWTMDISKSFK